MKKNINIIRIPFRSPEWYKFRGTGIGASDVPIVMGLLPYRPTKMELYHQKVGTEVIPRIENEATFWGIEHEDKVADMWQYWDGDPNMYMKNRSEDLRQRRCRNLNGIIQNPKYPWLFGDVDRLMNIGSARLDTGEIINHECPLECKTISHYASNMWKDGIPRYHLIQLITYMLILEVDYGEIATLKDARHFDVLPVAYSEIIAEQIIEQTRKFWYDRVVPAKEAWAEYQSSGATKKNKFKAEIQRLEPEPDANPKYMEYLSERFQKEDETMEGEMKHFQLAKGLKEITAFIKEATSIKTRMQNHLRKAHVDNKVERIDFGEEGYTRFYGKEKQTNRTLDNRVKPLDMDELKDMSLIKFQNQITSWEKENV